MYQSLKKSIAGDRTVEQAYRDLGISDATYYTWRKNHARMKIDQLKRLNELQKEDAHLKKLVPDLLLEKAI